MTRYQDETYRALFDAAGEGILVADVETRKFVDANPAICAMLGYPRAELLELGVEDIHPKEALERVIAEFEAQASGEKLLAPSLPCLRKDGTVFVADITTTPAVLEGRRCNIGLFTDRTQLHEAEESVRREHEQLLSVLNAIDEAIYIADPETYEVLFTNEALVRTHGESVGRKCYRAFHELDEPCSFCTNPLIFGEHFGKTRIWESQNRRNGRWYRCIDRGIQWPDGRHVRYEMAIDIHEQKNAELERFRAQKLESLGLLAGGIAHDFNNLLGSILGSASLARLDTKTPDRCEKHIDDVEAAVEQAQKLTQQLLTFSRGGEPVRRVAPLSPFLQEQVSFSLRGTNVAVTFDIPDDLPNVLYDGGQLGQVINNLVLNAVQSMPDGGRLDVACRHLPGRSSATSAEAGQVEVTIRDHGCGIPEDSLAKIFDPYFTTKPKGSGLGLAVVHSIVTKHDGSISVSSVVGEGTTFTMRFPASSAEAEVVEAATSTVPKGKGRVLVLKDDDLLSAVLEQMLTALEYEVTVVGDGSAVLEAHAEGRKQGRPYDVVILDLTIPGGAGGLETCHALKAIDSSIKAIVSSGYSTAPVMSDWQRHGFDGALVKPFRVATLAALLDKVLGGSGGGRDQ